MYTRENIQSGFWFSLGFGIAILMLTAGCFYLTEAGLNLLNPKQEKGETQMNGDEKVTEVDLSGQPRSSDALREALAVVEITVVQDALKVPSRLMVQLPTVRDALKDLLQVRELQLQVRKPYVGNEDFKEDCFALRAQIEETKAQTMLVFKEHPVFTEEQTAHDVNDPPGEGAAKRARDHSEMKANLKLSFRHLEDARMRLGKAIQAFDGGKSCYPR